MRLLTLFAIPGIIYAVGVEWGAERIWQIAITIALIIPAEIIWWLVVALITKLINGSFHFFIDVVPADGRTKDQSKLVLENGEAGIAALELEKPADEWTDETLETIAKGDVFGAWFNGNRRKRLYALRDYYRKNPDVPPGEYHTEAFLEENGMSPSALEQILSNKMYRGLVIAYSFLLYLLITNPMGT